VDEEADPAGRRLITMHLIQILLPLHDNDKEKFPAEYFDSVRNDLTNRFGGVTAFLRSPAVGLWKTENDVSRDEVVMFEVISPDLDEEWWFQYRIGLQKKFRQDELLIYASQVKKL
jgi:hypothetical protein